MGFSQILRTKWGAVLLATCLCLTFIYFNLGSSGTLSAVTQTQHLKNRNIPLPRAINAEDSPAAAVTATVPVKPLTIPDWYKNQDWGLESEKSLEEIKVTHKGLDNEEETAWNNFFYGQKNGLMLEMGAMNGDDFSVSHFFEKKANWKIILIEGNPDLASQLPRNRPKALNLNVAICDTPKQVHFMAHGGLGGIDVIVEFMTPGYIQAEFPKFLTNGTLDMKKVSKDKRVKEVQCLPLTDILIPLKIKHINFLMLDVEGGELNILNAIDFDQITFDVIAVESDRGREYDDEFTKNYVNSIVELLTSKGYKLWERKLGRNSWFYAPGFTPSAKS